MAAKLAKGCKGSVGDSACAQFPMRYAIALQSGEKLRRRQLRAGLSLLRALLQDSEEPMRPLSPRGLCLTARVLDCSRVPVMRRPPAFLQPEPGLCRKASASAAFVGNSEAPTCRSALRRGALRGFCGLRLLCGRGLRHVQTGVPAARCSVLGAASSRGRHFEAKKLATLA